VTTEIVTIFVALAISHLSVNIYYAVTVNWKVSELIAVVIVNIILNDILVLL